MPVPQIVGHLPDHGSQHHELLAQVIVKLVAHTLRDDVELPLCGPGIPELGAQDLHGGEQLVDRRRHFLVLELPIRTGDRCDDQRYRSEQGVALLVGERDSERFVGTGHVSTSRLRARA